MKKIKIIAVLAVLFCMLSVSSAFADGILVGEWGGNFDKIVLTSTEGIFEDPGATLDAYYTEYYASIVGGTYDATVFSNWTVSYDSSEQVTISGPEVDILLFWLVLNSTYEYDTFSLEFYVYSDGVLVDWATVYYSGAVYEGGLNNQENFEFVSHSLPEPASLLLLALGLIGIVPLRKKMQ